MTDSGAERDARVRSKNKKALALLAALCLVLAALGFLFAAWLFTLPAVVKPGGH